VELLSTVLQRVRTETAHAIRTQSDDLPAAGWVAETSDLKEVVFRFDITESNRIQIAGEFNNWIPDKHVETEILDGALQKILRVRPGGYEYRLIIDGVWQQDPANPMAAPNDMGGYSSLLNV
jgi:Glycogen recognition site of AMP-activated protein kinase